MMTLAQAQERVKKLRREIERHRYLYHVLNRPEISEESLDSLKHELTKIEQKFPELITPDSPTQRVAGALLPGFKKVRHQAPMISLNDVFSQEELTEWETRIKKLTKAGLEYFAELKVDGFAVSLYYQKGLFKMGATRGDGKMGEDVTENLKTIESIPLRLHEASEFGKEKEVQHILEKFPRVRRTLIKIPEKLEVRGEVYMTKPVFAAINRAQEKKGLPLFANPRNIAAGSVRQLDPKITASRKLEFLAYDVITDLGQKTHEEDHLIAKILGFKTVDLASVCQTTNEVTAFWEKVLSRREKLPFLIDGIVVQVNSSKIFTELGVVGKAPRGAVAYKFPGKEATTLVKDIVVQVGRTGVLTPVAILEPVDIGGVTVSRATLHNADEIKRLDVRVRDTVVLQRAGDVIPDIIRVLKKLRPSRAKSFAMPRTFCGQKVIKPKNEVAHRIPHPEKCELARRERFYHFVSKSALDIKGLGPKIIDALIDSGLIQDPSDLFLLHEGDLTPLERFAEKSAANLVASIQEKKEIELSRLIYGLGIFHVGEETAIDLANNFGTLNHLQKATLEELKSIPNIGEVVAESIYRWFRDENHKKLLEKLERAGVKATSYKLQATSYKLKGLTFVLTGGLESMSRDQAKSKIRNLGGEISESVSAKTNYVVAGAEPGSKFFQAQNLRIKIINEKEFLKMVE